MIPHDLYKIFKYFKLVIYINKYISFCEISVALAGYWPKKGHQKSHHPLFNPRSKCFALK